MENLEFKKYIGVKIMDATPMKRTDAENILGHKITPSKKSNQDDGYLVKYEDDYLSWSPKDVFEKAYHKYKDDSLDSTIIPMCSPDYKQRFIAEYKQVEIRFNKLRDMCDKWDRKELSFTPTCPRSVYNDQLLFMLRYILILKKRANLESVDVDNQ